MADIGILTDYSSSSKKVTAIAAGEAHTLALTEEGSVFSWGRGTFGRLGTGKEQDEVIPVRVEFDSSEKNRISNENFDGKKTKIMQIAAGAYHSLALEDDGSVWCWGYNIHGQLGLNVDNSLVPCFMEKFLALVSPHPLTANEPDVEKKEPLKVCSIKAGGMMSLAIDNLGGLWMWGNCPLLSHSSNVEFSLVSSPTPLPVWHFHGHTVSKVACGNEHVVALVSAGETFTGENLVCYSWGNNNHGQLGLGDNESRFHPDIIETFDHKAPWSVYDVACGACHTAVLTRRKVSGDVVLSSSTDSAGLEERETICWTFGLGENGQLGHGTSNSTYSPKPVAELPLDTFLISVDCGLFHTCAVSSLGDVWSWGMERGLGLCPDASFAGSDITGDAVLPLRIDCNELYGPGFTGSIQVACGAAHTVLVADNGHKLWAWGRGRSGVLGKGNTIDSYIPCVVMWPPLDEDFQEGQANADGKPKVETMTPGKVVEMEPKSSVAMEEVELLKSKLTLMEHYAAILHGSVFGKPFEERDLPLSLKESGVFNIAKEWENMLESADTVKLKRLEMFYRDMLGSVKDQLLKRRIQELITESLHSSSTKNTSFPM
ncbi:ultraviolet-B receptor UVR8-like [Papaver somniferum]|uniref:ultraviolet-B receptor UVR8-like n=1 Tax=Papaver somniferum TaxID=3469 RepID=UPI000E6F6B68|nr:ultraviolet-B receptor UVR8-like [Papaver somniferum]